MQTFNIGSTVAPVKLADKPWFVNTEVGAVKLFTSDIGEWTELLEAITAEKLSADVLEVSVKEVDFYALRDTEALNPALAGVKGTLIQLDEAGKKTNRFEAIGSIYVRVTSEYFEEPLEASISILKRSSNELLNKIYNLVEDEVLDVWNVSNSDKKERKLLKAIPK